MSTENLKHNHRVTGISTDIEIIHNPSIIDAIEVKFIGGFYSIAISIHTGELIIEDVMKYGTSKAMIPFITPAIMRGSNVPVKLKIPLDITFFPDSSGVIIYSLKAGDAERISDAQAA